MVERIGNVGRLCAQCGVVISEGSIDLGRIGVDGYIYVATFCSWECEDEWKLRQ